MFQMMEDVPRPLPRTRISAKGVRKVDDRELDENYDSPPKPLRRTKSRQDSVTVIQIEDEPDTNSVHETFHKNTSAVQSETQNDKPTKLEHSIETDEKSSSDVDPKSENLSSIGNKDSEENTSISANMSDVSTKENVINDDDDDDVIDEILKYRRTASRERNTMKDDTSSSLRGGSGSMRNLQNADGSESSNQLSEDLLGICIHRSDCLKMNHIIRHPSVMVHIVDSEKDGVYLQKSKPDKNVTYHQEQSSFILPVMTRPFNFKENRSIIPEWEETLTFNETTSYVIRPSTIFFFEVVDFVDSTHTDDEYASVGWRRIAWAFLKPVGANNVLNVEKLLRLQLYKPVQKSKTLPSVSVPCVYKWYKRKKWNPYPSTLFVTVKNISYNNVDSKPQQRSCTPFQPEVGSDASVKSLAAFSNDDEYEADNKLDNSSALIRLNDLEWSRMPGQTCKIPNSKISTLHPDPRGCLAVKFSNSGIFLACGTSSDVFIYAIDGAIEKKLVNHQGLIYTLSWFTDDSLLLSASADCTACIWDMKSSNLSPIQMLPHPAFVYCSTFLYPEKIIVTGSYDGMVRIWYQTHVTSKVWQLHQELPGHKGFVNALCSFRNKEFFSGDSVGVIVHWAFDECGRWTNVSEIRLMEIQNIIINKLIVFPGDKRLMIHTRDSLLRTLDIKTEVAIQWYQGGLNDSFQCNCAITPCGSFVLSASEDGTVNVWESNTGKQVAFYSGNFVSGCGGAVDYHPHDHIAVFSFYSSKSSTSSSVVYLLKYSLNASNDIDIGLYILSDTLNYAQKNDNVTVSSINGEENESSSGKLKMRKKAYQPFRY